MSTRPRVGLTSYALTRRYIVELWQAYLNPCCPGCRTGTADCDFNPLRKPPTQSDCAFELMRLGECP